MATVEPMTKEEILQFLAEKARGIASAPSQSQRQRLIDQIADRWENDMIVNRQKIQVATARGSDNQHW